MAGIMDFLSSIIGGGGQKSEQAQQQAEVPEGVRKIFGMDPDEFRNRMRAVGAGISAPSGEYDGAAGAFGRGFGAAQKQLGDQEALARKEALMGQEAQKEEARFREKMDFEKAIEERRASLDERKLAAESGSGGKAPSLVEMYDENTGMPYKAVWDPETQGFKRVGGMKAPSGTQLSVDPVTGAVTFQQGSGLKPLTEGQSKDTVYSTRAEGALPLIDEMGNALTSLSESVGGQVPAVGNYLKSPEYQMAENAGREFLAAILRKDTGAAITSQEMAEYGAVYLPRPGDSPQVLAQKQQARARALAAMKAGMPQQALDQQQKALHGGDAGSGATGETQTGKRLRFDPETGELE